MMVVDMHTKAQLYRAATNGDVDRLDQAIEKLSAGDELLDMESLLENSVLHVAASFGHDMIAKRIVKKCPSLVTKRNSVGDTALHIAAREGHLSVSNFLIDYVKNVPGDVETGHSEDDGRGGLLRMTNMEGNTALHEAVKYGRQAVANALIDAADAELLNLVNNNGESCFHLAAQVGLQELVGKLLERPVDLLLQERKGGKTALHAAIRIKHTGIIRELVQRKPELLELRDYKGRGALHFAVAAGSVQIVTDLLKSDPSIAYHQECDGTFPIHKAVSLGRIKSIQEILQYCPDSRELRDAKGRNALHVAVASGQRDMVKYILRAAELVKLINERDVEGNTPLHIATRDGNAMIVDTLVRDKRVDLSAVNKEGLTARDIAADVNLATEPSLDTHLVYSALEIAQAPFSHGRVHKKLIIDQEKKIRMKNKELMKEKMNTLLLVVTLIVTVTFAAGFTMPGGFNENDPQKGMATLVKKVRFRVFVISNTIAMYSAIVAALTIVWAHLGNTPIFERAMHLSVALTAIALTMMAVAFGAGVNLVVSEITWLAVLVLVISFMSVGYMFPLFILYLLPLLQHYPWISVLQFRLLLYASSY